MLMFGEGHVIIEGKANNYDNTCCCISDLHISVTKQSPAKINFCYLPDKSECHLCSEEWMSEDPVWGSLQHRWPCHQHNDWSQWRNGMVQRCLGAWLCNQNVQLYFNITDTQRQSNYCTHFKEKESPLSRQWSFSDVRLGLLPLHIYTYSLHIHKIVAVPKCRTNCFFPWAASLTTCFFPSTLSCLTHDLFLPLNLELPHSRPVSSPQPWAASLTTCFFPSTLSCLTHDLFLPLNLELPHSRPVSSPQPWAASLTTCFFPSTLSCLTHDLFLTLNLELPHSRPVSCFFPSTLSCLTDDLFLPLNLRFSQL